MSFIDYDGLIVALKARMQELGLNNTTMDEAAGMSEASTNKYFGDSRSKRMAAETIFLYSQALGLRWRFEPDPELVAVNLESWAGKQRKVPLRAYASKVARLGENMIARVLPAVAREMGKRGGKLGGHARALKHSPAERSNIARIAASARWAKHRELRDKLNDAANAKSNELVLNRSSC